MDGVHVGVPLESTALYEIEQLKVTRVYVMANKSSKPLVENFVKSLDTKGVLAAPINCDVSMGGAEDGLLKACNEAAAVNADCVFTIGGEVGPIMALGGVNQQRKKNTTMAATVKGIQERHRIEIQCLHYHRKSVVLIPLPWQN
jgi:hypothetical protein